MSFETALGLEHKNDFQVGQKIIVYQSGSFPMDGIVVESSGDGEFLIKKDWSNYPVDIEGSEEGQWYKWNQIKKRS